MSFLFLPPKFIFKMSTNIQTVNISIQFTAKRNAAWVEVGMERKLLFYVCRLNVNNQDNFKTKVYKSWKYSTVDKIEAFLTKHGYPTTFHGK